MSLLTNEIEQIHLLPSLDFSQMLEWIFKATAKVNKSEELTDKANTEKILWEYQHQWNITYNSDPYLV